VDVDDSYAELALVSFLQEILEVSITWSRALVLSEARTVTVSKL